MKTKFGATILATAFLAALVFPWTVLAGGGGGGKGGGGTGKMGGDTIRNQTQMENRIRTRDAEQFRMRDGEGNRDRIRNGSGTEPAAAPTESPVSATGENAKKGNTYGPGDGTGPYLPKDGTGYGAPANR